MGAQLPSVLANAGSAVSVETPLLRFRLWPENGSYEIDDRQTGVVWRSNPYQPRFGEVTLNIGGKPQRVPLDRCEVSRSVDALEAAFHPLADRPAAWLRVRVRPLGEIGPDMPLENVKAMYAAFQEYCGYPLTWLEQTG
jgi:hypothetical protein